jgi:hypothetical protein
MSEKKSIKEQADDIRKDLDELIGHDSSSEISDRIETDPQLPAKRQEHLMSFSELKLNSTKKAKKTISALMKISKLKRKWTK